MTTTIKDATPNVILVLGSELQLTDVTKKSRSHNNHSSNSSSTSKSTTPPPTPPADTYTLLKQEKARWPCHKHILSQHSKYFEAMFACEFEESGATIIFMPCGIFNSASTLDNVLQYMYTSTLDLIQPPNLLLDRGSSSNSNNNSDDDDDEQRQSVLQQQLAQLQDLYAASDYLGMPDLCNHLTDELTALAHHFTCYCETCTYIVPSLFAFSQPRVNDDPCMMKLTQSAMAIMTFDPEKALVSFWTSPSMIDVLWSLYSHQHYAPTVDNPLTQSLLNHISKTSAIESLHGCHVGARQLAALDDEHDSILHATFKAARSKATRTIATHFDFYCSEYPTLLSCIDGIIYTSAFMEYLLLRTIRDQMMPANACTLYQGIVRHLMARHAVQHSSHLKKIFNNVKDQVVHYIFYHVKDIRAINGFEKLDNAILNQLAQDLALPLDRLVTAIDHHNHHHHHNHSPTSQQKQGNSNNIEKSQQSSWTKFLSKKKYTSNKRSTVLKTNAIPKFEESHYKKKLHCMDDDDDSDDNENDFVHNSCPHSPPTSRRAQSWSIRSMILRWNKTYQMEMHTVAVGRRVELVHRPVLTTGTVAYVGHVAFADGIWVGVELDRRVGKSDGSVDGHRYFATSPSRGEFVKMNQLRVLLS